MEKVVVSAKRISAKGRTIMMKKYCILTGVVLVLLSLVCSPGYAQDDSWKFHLVPYLWMSGLNGDVMVKGLPAEVDASFGDLWDALDMAFLLHAEVEKGKWGLLLDPVYFKLSKDAKAGSTNVKVELTEWIVDLGAFYSLLDAQMIRIDALAGGRYMSLDMVLDVTGIGDVSGSKSWFDPIVGARMMADFTEKLRFTARADVGGFGVGSNLAWNLSGFLGYQFTPLFSLWGGYRVLDVDYEDGSKGNRDYFKYDMTTSGPVIGLGFTF